MSTNTSGGTTTSLNNTPQAKDDFYWLNEDFLGVSYFDVMANDLGGKAKVLWAIDDGDNGGADLIDRDLARAEHTATERSAMGAKIWITSDGRVGYDGSALSASAIASLQALAEGQTATDTFTYSIRLANGTLSWATVTITYVGTNDAPDIFMGAGDSAAATLAETDAPLTAFGTLTVIDPDTSDTVSTAVTGLAVSGSQGSLTTAQLQAMLSLSNALGNAADPGSAGNLGWAFDSGAATFDYLASGESLTLTYTLTSTDNHGATDTQTVTINILGTNDAAVLSTDVRNLTETNSATDISTSGTLTISDVDSPES
ncbi:MAG TPA: VCBS domain-containing protein, partial [Sphingomicrobium sp.]|nr:VCBS domain-containing protein [Sphingomicrobium sp.]